MFRVDRPSYAKKAKMQRTYSNAGNRSVTSISSLRTYSLDSKRSSAISLYQQTRFQRFCRAVQGVFGKAKLKPRGKRLNVERLKHVQDRLADMKYQLVGDKNGVIHTHLQNYAPLYVLKLVSVIFADDMACLKLEKANSMTWGIRSREVAPFISLATARDKFKDNVRRPLLGLVGDRLPPKVYLARVVQECWTAITNGHSEGNGRNKASGSRYPRQDARWFLHHFCVIYGFAAVKLQIPNNLLSAQLTQIAALPMMAEYTPKNEDTLYALELGYSYMAQSQHRMATKQSTITLREPQLGSDHCVSEGNDSGNNGAQGNRASRKRRSGRQRQNHLSFLYPTPVPTVFPAVLTQPDTNPQASVKETTVDASLTVGTEITVMHLVECLTRSYVTSGLTANTISEVIQSLPRMLQTPPPLTLFDELQVSMDYLLATDIPAPVVGQASHWFRESADHRDLKMINELGFEEYFDRTLTKPPSQPNKPPSTPPSLQVHRAIRMSPTRPPPSGRASEDHMLIRLTPRTARGSCPSLPAPPSPTPYMVSAKLELPDPYVNLSHSIDNGHQALRRPIIGGFQRRVSRGTSDTQYTDESENTRVPLDEDWKLPTLPHRPFSLMLPSMTQGPKSLIDEGVAIGDSPPGSQLPAIVSRYQLSNFTLVASHIKYCVQQLPDGLIPDPVLLTIMQLLPETQSGSVLDDFRWFPEMEEVTLIRCLLSLSPWRFYLLQQIVQITQVVFNQGIKDPISPFGLAIVLPVYEAKSSVCLRDLDTLKRWNWCWGCLLSRGKELFLDPSFPLVTERDRSGFGYTMYLLKHVV
ncbi:hypothetical protein IWQ61_001980 [Dispira simplex]|nr:hypothetical protein IWQ61_001980 [Dispira simplex]